MKQITNLFFDLARQHKTIKGFFFGKSYEKGAANEAHPLVWLDDPIVGSAVRGVVNFTVNVDILDIPQKEEDVINIQESAFRVGLLFADVISKTKGYSVEGVSFISLRDYYDNSAAGQRFTYSIVCANPIDRCADDLDPFKTFAITSPLPNFSVSHPEGCTVFPEKSGFPKIDV